MTDAAKKFKNPCKELTLWKTHVVHEAAAAKNWEPTWGWIQKEYEDLHKKLKEVSDSVPDHNIRARDKRTIKPIPESVNHEYGWISTKQDFNLQTYGPDVYKPMPIPDEF